MGRIRDHISLRTQGDWRRERSSDHTGNDHVHRTCETLMDCLAESCYGRLNNFYVWSFQPLRNWPDVGTKLMRLMRKCQRELRYATVTTVQDVTARLGRAQLISPQAFPLTPVSTRNLGKGGQGTKSRKGPSPWRHSLRRVQDWPSRERLGTRLSRISFKKGATQRRLDIR